MDIDSILDVVSQPVTEGVVSELSQIGLQKLKDFTEKIQIWYFAEISQTDSADCPRRRRRRRRKVTVPFDIIEVATRGVL